ncbi:MAG TPA: hypothetical protein VGF21_02055 [Thermoleophilaceae bacterium]|jgi:hypothetical protein
MATTNSAPTYRSLTDACLTGKQVVLASYDINGGRRQLVGERIQGRVALSDIPEGDTGRVYLVERHVCSKAELEALVTDYLDLALRLGRPPLERDWIYGD